MNYNFEIEYESHVFPTYAKRMLQVEGFRAFLPMSFVREEKKEKVYYDCSGFIPLRDLEQTSIGKLLTLFEELLLQIKEAGNYLLFPENFCLCCDTIYVEAQQKTVRIAYVPGKQEKNLICSLWELTEELEKYCEEGEARLYLERIRTLLHKNPGLTDLIAGIGELKRDAYLCGHS